jgi:SPP1 family predicted phage head-tail adaptor
MPRGDFIGGLNPGRLRRKIAFEDYQKFRDTDGSLLPVAKKFPKTAWAEIESLQGRENEAGEQIAAFADFRITVRYAPTVTTQMKVIFGTRKFEILSVAHDEARRTRTDLYCREINRP